MAAEETDLFKPSSGSELRDEIATLRMRTFNRVSATAPGDFLMTLMGYEVSNDSEAPADQEDGNDQEPRQDGKSRQIHLLVFVSVRPTVFGVRAGLRVEDTKHLIAADSAVEYSWKRPVEYNPTVVREFLTIEAVPRLITYVWTVINELAQTQGFNVQYHPLRMPESDVVEMVMKQFEAGRESGSYAMPN